MSRIIIDDAAVSAGNLDAAGEMRVLLNWLQYCARFSLLTGSFADQLLSKRLLTCVSRQGGNGYGEFAHLKPKSRR